MLNVWSKRPGVDVVLLVVVAGGYLLARGLGASPVVTLSGDTRSSIYTSLIPIAGAILAFVVVPAAIVLAIAPGKRLAKLLSRHPGDLGRGTSWAALFAVATMAISIVGIAFDTGRVSERVIEYLALIFAGILVLAALRMVYLFWVLLSTIDKDHQDEPDLESLNVPPPAEAAAVRVISKRPKAS
jgi:uncharacterized membrane protein